MVTRTKRIAALMVAMAFTVASLVGCGGNSSSSSSNSATNSTSSESSSEATTGSIYDAASTIYNPDGGNKIGITVIDNVIPHCQAYINGAKSVIEEHGDVAVVLDPGFDAIKQAENISDFIAQGCVGIVCETIDGNALITVVQDAVSQGVMVASGDFPFGAGYEDLVCSQVMTPNEEAGAVLAERMFEDVGEGANIVILATDNAGSQARADGFRKVCEEKGMNIIFDGDGGGEVEKANTVMRDLLQANDKIDAVICSNDEQAIGAYTAAESVGRADEVKCYGFDGAPEACEFIKKGQEVASLGQLPFEMGKQSALDLYRAMLGEDVGEYWKYIGYEIIDIDNADTRTEEYYSGLSNYTFE